MKDRPVRNIRITVTPGKAALTALYGATVKDGVKYMHAVHIDDEFIWGDGVDLSDFEAMLEASGDYWPFFCSYCGEPGCAGIFSPVRCFHKDDLLILVVRRPLLNTCDFCDDSDQCAMEKNGDSYDCPKCRPHYRAYRIRKEQLREQLQALKSEFGDALNHCRWAK